MTSQETNTTEAQQDSRQGSDFLSEARNAGCPYCAHYSYQRTSKTETFPCHCRECGESFSQDELTQWIEYINAVILGCTNRGWKMLDLADQKPPFPLGQIAQDRQDYLARKVTLREVTDLTHYQHLIRQSKLRRVTPQRAPKIISEAISGALSCEENVFRREGKSSM